MRWAGGGRDEAVPPGRDQAPDGVGEQDQHRHHRAEVEAREARALFADGLHGKEKEEVILDSPLKGLVIDNMQWHEMYDFSSDCVLMVIANDFYDESDYIRNYGAFESLVK